MTTLPIDPLNKILSKSGKLSEDSIVSLLELWHKSKKLKAREILLNFNQQDSYLYFVSSGCLRLFVVDNQHNEVNIGFGFENTFITSFQSFIQEKPSLLSIEAISESVILAIHKQDLKLLINENKEISEWYQSLLEITLSGHIQRQTELLTLSPQEKYEVFIKRSGHLINSIPLKHIASYLMMSPETLSRVRSKLS